LRALKERFPKADIDVVSSRLNQGVLQNNPALDRVFLYDKKGPLGHAGLIGELRRRHYDLAIILHTVSFSFTSVMLAVLSGARIRVGSTSHVIGDELTGSYLNLTLPLPSAEELAAMSETEHNLYPLSPLGVATDDLSPKIYPTAESEAWAETFAHAAWDPSRVRLAVHPGAGKTQNIWPIHRFGEVVNQINASRPVSLVTIEGPRDEASVSAFHSACDVDGTVVRGRHISDVAAVLRRADLVICNDTGVMHVSASAGARTLAIFGPTDPARWAPRCDGLHVIRAPEGVLENLSAHDVAERALDVLGISSAG
jgi:ADP-heptose:LPS heptosyltransferase